MSVSKCIPSLPDRFLKTAGLVLLLLLLWVLSAVAVGESSRISEKVRENPHTMIDCSDCHITVPERGKSTWKEIAAGLTDDPVALCRGCHPATEVSHHSVRVKNERGLPEGLPSSVSGEVICSTCHDVHMAGSGASLLRGFDTGRYSVRMDMCLDCHGEMFSSINPHREGMERKKCYTCHEIAPRKGDTSATVTFKGDIIKICDFCHNVMEKKHPLNVDPMRKLPDVLPRGKSGAVNCGTCHDPHGVDGTLHFLRRKYVEFLETGRYINPHGLTDHRSCEGCHNEVVKDKEKMRKNLRYGGDPLRICLSCHGAMDTCHPILVKPGPGMKPPEDMVLSGEGKITCLTCHDPMPVRGSGVALRGRSRGEPINAMCLRCHDSLELFINPHASMSDRNFCKFCHDTMTDPTNEEAGRVSFISNTRLICLRCHPKDKEAHPVGNHMVAPKMGIPELFHLDSKGKITCTTCHNPHINVRDPAGGEQKRRFVADVNAASLCLMCHKI